MDIIEMTEEPTTEEQEESRQQELFSDLEDLLLRNMSMASRAGASAYSIASALAGTVARFIEHEIKEGREGSFLQDDFIPQVLGFIEQDRRRKRDLN